MKNNKKHNFARSWDPQMCQAKSFEAAHADHREPSGHLDWWELHWFTLQKHENTCPTKRESWKIIYSNISEGWGHVRSQEDMDFNLFFFVCKIAWGLYRKGCKRYKQRENAFVSSKASDMDKLLAVAAKTTFRIRPWHCSYGMANQPTPPRRTPTNKTLWKALLTIGFP